MLRIVVVLKPAARTTWNTHFVHLCSHRGPSVLIHLHIGQCQTKAVETYEWSAMTEISPAMLLLAEPEGNAAPAEATRTSMAANPPFAPDNSCNTPVVGEQVPIPHKLSAHLPHGCAVASNCAMFSYTTERYILTDFHTPLLPYSRALVRGGADHNANNTWCAAEFFGQNMYYYSPFSHTLMALSTPDDPANIHPTAGFANGAEKGEELGRHIGSCSSS